MIDKADRQVLLEQPAFRRFLFALVRDSGLLTAREGQEGRRSLALDVLNAFEEAQPVKSTSGLPVLTLIQTLSEEGQSAVKEKPLGRRRDQYRDLDDRRTGDGDGDPDE